jgi:hypothetical protein
MCCKDDDADNDDKAILEALSVTHLQDADDAGRRANDSQNLALKVMWRMACGT